jgi:hypothetical protein
VPGNPLLGAAVGAGVGLAIYWDANHRDDSGIVYVERDGQREQREWIGQPENFVKTPAEMRTVLHATGVLGDRVIPKAQTTALGQAQSQILEEVDSHKLILQKLSKERRLLANLGAKTRYGKDALQLITAAAARELMSRGKSVVLLSLGEIKDTDHNLTTSTYSQAFSKKLVEAYQYTERTFDYELRTLKEPKDLLEVPEGQGLPDTTDGIPTEGSSFTQTIYKSEEQAARELNRKLDKTQSRFAEAMVGRQESKKDQPFARTLKAMVNPSTVGYTAVGALLGATVGSGVPGLDPGAAATIGGVIGHFAGRAAVSRAVKAEKVPDWAPQQSSPSFNKWAAIGAGALTGVALGYFASQAQGNAGEVSSMAIGASGGACSGLLLANPRKNVDRAMTVGALGFIGGAGLGVAKILGLDNLATTVALGALGGVMGGCTAAVLLRSKRPS